MTTLYLEYLNNINEGIIDINNVNFSCLLVSKYYKPSVSDTRADVTSVLYEIPTILQGNDMNEMEMSQIVERVQNTAKTFSQVDSFDKEAVAAFVVFCDSGLCFHEPCKIE